MQFLTRSLNSIPFQTINDRKIPLKKIVPSPQKNLLTEDHFNNLLKFVDITTNTTAFNHCTVAQYYST